MARRFLTRDTIDDLIKEGHTTYQLQGGDVVTDHARDHARSKGLQLIPAGADAPAQPAQQAGPRDVDPVTRSAVRSAVITALGRVPDNLDEVIDKALRG